MKSYVVFNELTGEIITSGFCQDIDFELQAVDGKILEGKGSSLTHYVKNNSIIPYTENQALSKNTRHPFYMVWSNEILNWVDTRNLEDIKKSKWDEIKQARNTAEFGGFTWDGSQFDSDAISQQRISGAVQLAMINPNYTIEWTLSNNTTRNLSAQDVIAVGVSLGNHVSFQHEKARLLREQINSATTAEQVNAVVW